MADNSNIADELLAAHNVQRKTNGLPEFTLNDQLVRAAQVHADWMAAHGQLTHFGDEDPWRRMAEAGYKGSTMAENIAWNQVDVEQVMHDWMNSSGHRANILGPCAEMGAAIAKGKNNDLYWCVDFGTQGEAALGELPQSPAEPERAKHGYLVPAVSMGGN